MGDLIPALERVRAVRPEVAISCFGPTWDAPPLPPWVESLGYLTDEELVDFYDRCSIFVLPSHHEGWGLPAVEAMACGAAVVTTDCGGTRDFAQNEVNALVVGAGDVEGLFQAIIRLVDDAGLRTRLATAGPGVLASVSWDASAARTRARIAGGHGREAPPVS